MYYEYTSTPVQQYTNTPVHQYTSTPIHQYNSTTSRNFTTYLSILIARFFFSCETKTILGWNIYNTLLPYGDVGFQVRDQFGDLRTQYPMEQESSGENLYYRTFVGPLTILPNPSILDPYFEWVKGRGVTRRSEERRVGKECRRRWWKRNENKKRNRKR